MGFSTAFSVIFSTCWILDLRLSAEKPEFSPFAAVGSMEHNPEREHRCQSGVTSKPSLPVGPGSLPAGKLWWGHSVPGAIQGTGAAGTRSSSDCFSVSPPKLFHSYASCLDKKQKLVKQMKLNPHPHHPASAQQPWISQEQSKRCLNMGAYVSYCFVLTAMPPGQMARTGVGVSAASCSQESAGRGVQEACSWGLEAQWRATSMSAPQ